MSKQLPTQGTRTFEELRQTNEYGAEHHFAGVGKPIVYEGAIQVAEDYHRSRIACRGTQLVLRLQPQLEKGISSTTECTFH